MLTNRLLLPAIFSLLFLFPKFVSAQSETQFRKYLFVEKENKNNNYKSTLKFSDRSKITLRTTQKNLRYQGIITNINDSIIFVNGSPVFVSDIIFIKPNHNKILKPSIISSAAGLALLGAGTIGLNQHANYISISSLLFTATGACVSISCIPVFFGSLFWEFASPCYNIRKGAKIYIKTELVNENP